MIEDYIDAGMARNIYSRMVGIRKFEERVRYLFLEGIMPGTIHQCDGQEATAVGVCFALGQGDCIASTHRPHGHAIAKGLSFREIMAELFGKKTGCCEGKGGSMHLGNIEKGMLPAIAIVGGNIPISTGMALAFQLQGKPNVAVSFFGDGATGEGAFHEGLRLGAMYNLPCLYVCENNFYAASTHVSKTIRAKDMVSIADAYGIRGVQADGNDVLSVYQVAVDAVARARNGEGPTFLELQTYRRCGHSRRDAKAYMDKEEMAYWFARDPITLWGERLVRENLSTLQELENMQNEVAEQIEDAVNFAISSPDPLPEDTLKDVYATCGVMK